MLNFSELQTYRLYEHFDFPMLGVYKVDSPVNPIYYLFYHVECVPNDPLEKGQKRIFIEVSLNEVRDFEDNKFSLLDKLLEKMTQQKVYEFDVFSDTTGLSLNSSLRTSRLTELFPDLGVLDFKIDDTSFGSGV